MGFHPGQRIGRYILGSELARGGMGVVWRALDADSGQSVAIKVVADKLIDVGDFAERFADEVRRHSGLKHPNIVEIHEVFKFDGNFCMAMQLVEGLSLEALLQNQPENRLEPSVACEIIKGVLAPLDYAHRNRIVHRDVKPSNILLDMRNRPHLTDFGIAVAAGEVRRTRAGVVVGTSHYMSPEQIRTPRDIDHRTDVYSVGCMFYEMLTGRPPFLALEGAKGDSEFSIKSAHLSEAPVPPCVRVSSIPVPLSDLVLKALRKNPAERLAGCGLFLRMIENLEAQAARASPIPHAWLRYALFAVCSLFLLIVIAIVFT